MSTVVAPDLAELLEGAFDDLFEVVVLNDDVTTFDTVISALMDVCGHQHDAASRLAWRIHTEGSAVVAAGSHAAAEGMVSGLLARGLKAFLQQV